ncbi:MAG TPA: methyl-accepting chemotaxis protein [Bacillota bacterium]|nr:methyl-accepting chemotaxis protein [Bacillota bacterium]
MSWLRHLKIGRKLTLLITINIIFLISITFIGNKYMGDMNKRAIDLYNNNTLSIQYINDAIAQSRANEAAFLELAITTDKSIEQKRINEIKDFSQKYDQDMQKFSQRQLDSYESERISKWKDTIAKYRDERAKAMNLITEGKKAEGYAYFRTNAISLLDSTNVLLSELAAYNVQMGEKATTSIQDYEHSASIMVITIASIAIILASIVGITITKMLTNPIIETMMLMEKAEAGDLTVQSQYVSKDELGILTQSFNQMLKGLRLTITQVVESAANLAASSEQISASTEEIAGGSQQQAQSANNASELVKELAISVDSIAKNAEQAAISSEQTAVLASQGGEVIKDALMGMRQIDEKMAELADKSTQIGEIVEVIDDIAEQTNLLALNAAIEAARAGEAGKGFAVVADEVRKLAERSSKATKEIAALITSIQNNTHHAVSAVTAGNEKMNHAEKTFNEIVGVVQSSASKVTEIAAASEEQSAQSAGVLEVVENIAAITQQTSAGTQETAATANDLSKMADQLNSLAIKFKIA